ncbi:MAG: tetratricopeptide repeat protein [Xenococcaceae cyanobacterium]
MIKKNIQREIVEYQKAIELELDNSMVYAKLARVMMAQKNIQEAITNYQKAISLQPEQPPWVYIGLGDSLNQNSQEKKAITAYQKAIELEPNNSMVYAKLARVMMAQKNIQEAITNYQKAISLQPEQPSWVYIGLVNAIRRNGQLEEAISINDKAIKLKPNEHKLYLSLARLYQKKGDLESAIGIYKKVIKSEKDLNDDILRNIEEIFRLKEIANKSTNSNKKALLLTSTKPEEHLIASVSGFKDEADIAYYCLEWQYSLGVRRFVILDNMSLDNTAQEIRRFAAEHKNAMVYLIEDSEIRHYQSQKMTAAAEFAYKLWQTEWILPFDADEFLCSSHQPLHTILENIPKERLCIKIPLKNHVLTSIDDHSEKNPLKRMCYRANPKRGKKIFKVIIRWQPGMVIGQGNHKVCLHGDLVDSLNGEELGLFIRHYPWRSKKHLKRKILNGGRAHQEDSNIIGGLRWRKPYILYKLGYEEYLDELYKTKIRNPDNFIYDPAIPKE